MINKVSSITFLNVLQEKMTGYKCCICENYHWKSKKLGLDVMFHVFPRNTVYRKKWITFCNFKPGVDESKFQVCSDHFTEDDYEEDLKARLLSNLIKRKLKVGGIFFF